MVSVIVIALLAIGFVVGFRRGFILQVIHLVGFTIALIIAKLFYKQFAEMLVMWIPFPTGGSETSLKLLFLQKGLEDAYYNAIAFFIIFIAVKITMQIVASLFDFLAELPILKHFNRLLGGVLGFMEVYIIVFVVVTIIAMVPMATVQNYVQGSSVAKWIITESPFLSALAEKLWSFNLL